MADKGRPSSYSEKIADKIINLITTTSQGIVTICKDKKLPSSVTVYSWLKDDDYKDFLNRYICAREAQAHLLADEIIEIADNSIGDVTINENGKVVMDGEFAARSRIRVDARKWLASKLYPKKYGDKVDVTSGDKPIESAKITVNYNGNDVDLKD